MSVQEVAWGVKAPTRIAGEPKTLRSCRRSHARVDCFLLGFMFRVAGMIEVRVAARFGQE